jgi:PAS domain-containing protein
MGPRKKLLSIIAKLKARGAAALDESSSSTAAQQMSDGVDDDSSSDAAHVTVTALFKKKKASLSVGEHISLESLLIRLSQTFDCRVKVKLEDDDGDQIAISSDQELADALAGEDEVTLQCFKDLKWRQAVVASSKKGSASAASTVKTTAPDVVAEFADRYAMFDELLDPYVVIDAEGTVLAFNPSAEKLFSATPRRRCSARTSKCSCPTRTPRSTTRTSPSTRAPASRTSSTRSAP